MSPSIFALSGQNPPLEPPTDLIVLRVDSDSVELEWDPVPAQTPKTVDGYWIYAWKGPQIVLVIPPDAIRVQVAVRGVIRGVVTGLEPWTEYNIVVQGYNSGGLGPVSKVVPVMTLDSKNSYYILSLRITSEAYTEDLKDKSSSKFKILKADVTGEISKLYEKHPWFENAALLSFSPGSVQAEVQLEAANPNMSVVLQVVSSIDILGNFSIDQKAMEIRREPDLQNVTLSASHLRLNVSGKFVINCTVIGGPNDLDITWFKADKVIGLSHRTKVETGLRHSRLTVRDVMAEDEGNYTCQAIKGNQNGTASVFIGVAPVLEIKPRTVTKRVGDKATFTCGVVSGFRKEASVLIIEVTNKENKVRHQEMNFTATNLQIPEGEESQVREFVCEMTTQQNVLSRSEVAELIIIKPEAPKCPEELLDGVFWSATAAGRADVKPCPHGARGTASRICSEEVTWKEANFVGCSSAEYLRLGDEIEAITEGFQSNSTAQQVLSELVNSTRPLPENDTKRPPEIFGGDLVIAVKILVTLADLNAKRGNVSTEEDTKNFAQVASNLLESTNRITWQELEKLNQGQGQSLVKTMDDYGLGAAATFTGSTDLRVVQTKNLAMRIDRANSNSPLRGKGLTVAYNQSSIQLPPEAFSSSQDSRVVTLVYLTLNDVLPLGKESDDDDDDAALSANTTIVSSTIDPRPPAVLKKPVKIVLQNRKVNDPAGVTSRVTPQAKCVFWRPGESAIWQTSGCRFIPSESDVNKTTCQCDHLTIFASLMDPYGASVGEAHTKALEIISIVGCSISLLAVVVTIAVTLFFWRAVKSPRSKVLLNLCAAVAVSCILVISEGSARDNKVGCTILAALLHYFLLALFCWMLCEGVLHYFLIVKVFGGGAADKVKYFYIFGWGFPIIVVSISLGVTRADGYGSPEACWLDVSSGLIWAFIVPATVIILVNIVVFILVIRQMLGTRCVQNKTQIEKVKAGVKASAVILPLLGITWLFGLLSFSSSTIVFKYIFAIANSLQGLMIFIFHCLLNKQIKDAIKRRQGKSSTAGTSTTPKTKPSHIQNAKHATNLPGKAPANKRRSNQNQNDFEMVDSIDKQLPATEVFPQVEREEENNLPPLETP
ncbi:adhesion G protein-coupled receptor B2-like [Oculina patagonica]